MIFHTSIVAHTLQRNRKVEFPFRFARDVVLLFLTRLAGRIWTRPSERRALTRNPAVGSNELLREPRFARSGTVTGGLPHLSFDSAAPLPRVIFSWPLFQCTPWTIAISQCTLSHVDNSVNRIIAR